FIGLAMLVLYSKEMNALAAGEEVAASLGVRVTRTQVVLFVVSSLLVGSSIAVVGPIGFVGLVVPHMLRLAFGNDQRMLLPAAALGGGVAVMGADLIARMVIAPAQLPVGVITSIIGVPVFLWMLLRGRR
ncbi:MAG TPA: iron chelate uptake ABC transporter family permease subunit, partial [Paraburkholderia sp.]|uniref:FecCD family ABC transporter permease n=1 Tax=Paraburkholderia sp. TaxID=1926495 RepID=UPI002ED44FBB